jgi:hypothetical protein
MSETPQGATETVESLRKDRDFWQDEANSYQRVIAMMKDNQIKDMQEWREIIKLLAGGKSR